MTRAPGPFVALAWAPFQARTAALAAGFDGTALFVTGRLRGAPLPLPLRYLVCAARTWALLERHRPAQVLAVTPPVLAPLVAWAWCRRRRRPLVIDCHTDTFHSRKWAWARPLHRWLLRRSRAGLVHTQEALDLVEPWRAPVLLLPDEVPDRSEAVPAARGAGATVLVAGSMDGNEPVAESLAAAALLPEIEVRFTGDPERAAAAVRKLAPPNAVLTGLLPYGSFLGEMLAADVVAVLSTDPHIMNRAAFEAAGMGRPLVLSDLPGLRARFEGGALFTSNEPAAIAAALRRALAEREALAARSQDLARELRRQRERAMARLRRDLAGPPRERPARVLRLTQHPLSENALIRRDVDELLTRGCQVDLVCAAGRADGRLAPPPPGLRVYRVPIRHRRRPAIRYPIEYAAFFAVALVLVSALGLRRRYAAVEVDNLPDTLVFATAVPRLRGARVVFNMYELTPEMVAARFRGALRRPAVRLARLIEAAAIRWAHHVIVVSRPCFDVLRARGVPAARMSIVLNTQRWPDVHSRAVPGGAPVLITHTTLVARYGVHVAIEALSMLREAWPGLTLRVVGDGEQRQELAELARRLGAGDRVVFTGFLPWPETMAEIRRATLGIVAVVPDGYGHMLLPQKLLEYARLEVPAVCSRLPAIEAYFPPATLGYVTPGDPRDMAAQLDRLLRDPALAARQARGAAEIARGLSWEHVRLDYLRALALADGTTPARDGAA